MNFIMNIPGLKDVLIEKIEERGERIVLHVSLPKKLYRCPSCGARTKKVHDYRLQKIKHLKWFERLTCLFVDTRVLVENVFLKRHLLLISINGFQKNGI